MPCLFSTCLKEVTSSDSQNLYYKGLDCFRRQEADDTGIPRFIECSQQAEDTVC
jgi:hypothetical protein